MSQPPHLPLQAPMKMSSIMCKRSQEFLQEDEGKEEDSWPTTKWARRSDSGGGDSSAAGASHGESGASSSISGTAGCEATAPSHAAPSRGARGCEASAPSHGAPSSGAGGSEASAVIPTPFAPESQLDRVEKSLGRLHSKIDFALVILQNLMEDMKEK